MDDALVRRAQRGDAVALDAVLRALAPSLGRVCGAIALDAGDDALQEAMVAIARSLGTLREPAAVHGWARRIAVREAVRAAGGGRGQVAQRSTPVDPATLDPRVAIADGSTAVEVRAVLAGLDSEQRAVLVMRHLDGLDEAEMAAVMGVARGTVKSRLHRARAAFRERWTA